jgi:predicted AlkP superfamily phosphohydrolase/phosphomutase
MRKERAVSRRSFIQSSGLALSGCALGFPSIVQAKSATQSVIVLGIDGMDPQLLSRFIKEGRMPNAQRLISSGSFSHLKTSNPPQSPVAWSNFISGTNPGGHGIFDFIARDPSNMTPYLSTSRISRGKAENLRQGPAFWQSLQDHGVDSTILRMPANFPPDENATRTLSGLGTPDVHGSYGIFTFFTDRPGTGSHDVNGGRIESVQVRDHRTECTLTGPVNSYHRKKQTVDIAFSVSIDPVNSAAKITIQDRDIILQEGEWSDWVSLNFRMLPYIAETPAICRFYLKNARGPFELYVSPLNLDPADPALTISAPKSYAADIAGRIGSFYTQGMAQDTSARSSGIFSDDDYRGQALNVLDEEMRLFESELDRFNRGFFFSYFSSLDLNSHMFWRAMDPKHPLYSKTLAEKHGGFLPWLYQQMDGAIGKAMERVDDNTLLFVVSDHGFGSFRRQFNLNSWLLDNGYAEGAPGAERGGEGFYSDIRWGGTKAYGLGINSLYLNIRGREAEGSVAAGDDADALKQELRTRLKTLRDPETGELVISNVYLPSEIYSGPYLTQAPDLLIGYNRNYRASWDTILGKYPRNHFMDNTDPWSGDHATDSIFVPGVFLANSRIGDAQPALSDMAPTILSAFGARIPAEMTGGSILEKT